jgi:heme/copper-type cytochrome/quinol oxidase subunit 1
LTELLFLFLVLFVSVTSNNKSNSNKNLFRRSASGGSTFATHTEHTPAFNTVHIIAAVIGIVGAVTMAVTIFLICKRKRNRRNSQNRKATLATAVNDVESNMTQTITENNNIRFGQFASDFDNHVEPPKPAVTHVEDVSPMMQQYHLQLKLLQQQKAQKERKLNIDPHLNVATLNQTASSSSTSSSPNSLLPPPPYQP